MPPPIGPMSEKQRRIESVRRSIVDVELPLRRYFESFASLHPSEITPAHFAELQDNAFALAEAIRREMQGMYDLLDMLSVEATPQEQLTAIEAHLELERIKSARIIAQCAASTARWEAQKAAIAEQQRVRSWFG